jgi:D-tyrosyl-tRNA(Tyr) deacylase
VEKGDTQTQADRLAERIVAYRVFEDDSGRMNLDVRKVGGGVLLVSQFTLAANTDKGNRAGFDPAAPPEVARELFDRLVDGVAASGVPIGTGRFGAHMQVELTNDGPVTFSLRTPPSRPG